MNTENKQDIVKPLLAWFQSQARVLPWRSDPTPYHVWISEIMLQQTRVEAVKPFYARFLSALPTIDALAACPEDQLLKLWEGLGYYSRVRNLQKAAQLLVQAYGGELPAEYKELLKLPGIGSYTAGAISSIAYRRKAPAVDGNVLRVLSRVFACGDDISKQSVKKQFEDVVMEIIPEDAPGLFNQALMELGALICLPNGVPHCHDCPLQAICRACRSNTQGEYPKKPAKKSRRIEEKTVLVIRDTTRAALRQRPSRGLLAGLYELPNYDGKLSMEEALEKAKEAGYRPIRIHPLEPAKHIFSHVEWHMQGYLILVEESEEEHPETLFAEIERTESEYPIPAAFAAYTRYLNIRIGQMKFQEE